MPERDARFTIRPPPARAIASAVARPMPRPAPVTIATLPCSHPVASARAVQLHARSQCPVKAFVGHEARLESQVDDGMRPTLHTPDAADRLQCPCRAGD